MLPHHSIERIDVGQSTPLASLAPSILIYLLLLTTGCSGKEVSQANAVLKIAGTESTDSVELDGGVRNAPNGEKFRLVRLRVVSGTTSSQPIPGDWPTPPYLTDPFGTRFNLVQQWYKLRPGYTATGTGDGRWTYSDSIESTLVFGPTPSKSTKFLFHADSNDPITIRF